MAKYDPRRNINQPGTPGYDPNWVPQYIPPGEGETGAYDLLAGQAGQNVGYDQAIGRTYNLLDEPGTWSKMGLDPKKTVQALGKWYMGGAGIGDKFSESMRRSREIEAKTSLADLKAQTGMSGNIGSTIAGINRLDLSDRYLAQEARDESTAADLQERINQGRFGAITNVISGMAGDIGRDWTGRTLASQNLADLAMRQHGQTMGDYQAQYGMARDIRRDPTEHGFEAYQSIHNVPKKNKPSGLDVAFGVAGAVLPWL